MGHFLSEILLPGEHLPGYHDEGKDVAEHQNVREHEGRKYLRLIYPAVPGEGGPIWVDVYEVEAAYPQPDAASSHLLKKVLMAGGRGKGDRLADLVGARAALDRAIDLERRRVAQRESEEVEVKGDTPMIPSREEVEDKVRWPAEDDNTPSPPPTGPEGRKPEQALAGHLWVENDDTCQDCGLHVRELTQAWLNRGTLVACRNRTDS